MYMALLFILLLASVLTAWAGKRDFGISLFALFLIFSIITFIHHMTDVIGLSL